MVFTVEEVARYLHVHPSTIYRLLRQKELPAFKVGSDWRFNIESIDKWRFGMAEDARKRIKSRPL
jgi:excisionase family DNA binding protein